jgi:hypothetical protein
MLAERSGYNLRHKALPRRSLSLCLPVLAVLLVASNPADAATVVITSLLTNASFEIPASGCPTGWECDGSPGVGVYSPTGSQYTVGADGLPGDLTVPDGNQVLYFPDGLAGSGIIQQTTDTPWVAGNTYSYTFWLGTPYTEPDGTTPVTTAPTGAIRLYFLAGRVQAGLPAYDLTPPPQGQWEQLTYTVTPDQLWASGAAGQNIGVMFFISTDASYESANIDEDPPTDSPEPGTFFLGLAAIAVTWLQYRFHWIFARRGRACPVEIRHSFRASARLLLRR